MYCLHVVGVVISPRASHPFGFDVVGHNLVVICKGLVADRALPVLLDDFFGSAASASLLVTEVRDTPSGGEDLRCAEPQAEICVLSVPARDRSRSAIYGSDNIHSDEVSWDCSSVGCIGLCSLAYSVARYKGPRRTVRPLRHLLQWPETNGTTSGPHADISGRVTEDGRIAESPPASPWPCIEALVPVP